MERYTQCGKPGCKCMRGEKHGPAYYLAVSYAKGRTRQIYVPKDLKPLVEQWVRNYHQAMSVLDLLRHPQPNRAHGHHDRS